MVPPVGIRPGYMRASYGQASLVGYACACYRVCLMAKAVGLRRTSLFLDPGALERARRALGTTSNAETVRLSLERVAEMERFWRFMARSRRSIRRGSFGAV